MKKTNVLKSFDYTWTYEAAIGEDKAKSKLKYVDDFNNFANRVPLLGSEHPDLVGFSLVKINASRQEGDIIEVSLDYEINSWEASFPGREAGENATSRYNIEPSLSDEPIFSFHKVKDFTDEEKAALRTYQSSDRTATDYNTANSIVGGNADALAVLNALSEGQEAWRAPGMIWVRKRIIKSLSELPLSKIGKIDTPPGAPETPSGYSWMYLAPNISQSADGNTYQVEERWERSYEGGWNEFFYAVPAP